MEKLVLVVRSPSISAGTINNTSFLRVWRSPSLVTGIQSTSQNQVFGQTRARVPASIIRDFNVTFQTRHHP